MSEKMERIRLRPHHILCINGFQGKGYSRPFVDHMMTVIERLRDDPDQTIEVVDGADDLCAYCPHLMDDGICDQTEKVETLDKKAGAELCFRSGVISYNMLRTRVKEELTAEKLLAVCGDCQWIGLCLSHVEEKS